MLLQSAIRADSHDAWGTDEHGESSFLHRRLYSTPITAAFCIVMSSQVEGAVC